MSFAPEKVVQTGMNSYAVTYGDDNQTLVRFYDREFLDPAASEEAGRPIHKSKTYCERMFPGDKTKKMDEPVDITGADGKNLHLQYPRQFAAYQAQTEYVPEGTSLLEWPPLPRAEAMDIKASLKIHTVEQLASLPDSALTWLGAQQWRNKAKVWLDTAAGPAGVLKIQAENENLRADIEMLKQQIKDLASLKTEPEKRGPGRPKAEGN